MEKKDVSRERGLLDLTADALQGRQSVRVTFRLPEEAIALLSMAANQLGLKQKSLFDQLVEDQDVLNRVAVEGQGYDVCHDEKIQKTYVISRNSLIALKKIAKLNDMSRDFLVELSINRLRPVISAEQEKQRNWKIVQSRIEELVQHGRRTLAEAGLVLAGKDQVYGRIQGMVAALERGHEDINQLIGKGSRMDAFTETS